MRFFVFVAAAASVLVAACAPAAGPGEAPTVSANEVSCLNPVALQQLKEMLTPQIPQMLNDPYSMPEARRLQLALSETAPGLMIRLVPGAASASFDRTVTTAEDGSSALCQGDVVIANPVSFNLEQMQRNALENETVVALLTRGQPVVWSQPQADSSVAETIEMMLRRCMARDITCEFVRAEKAIYSLTPNTNYLSSLTARTRLTYSVDRTEQGQIVASVITGDWDQTEPSSVFSIDYDQVLISGQRQAAPACFVRDQYNGQFEYEEVDCP